jgi:hypothetical protein
VIVSGASVLLCSAYLMDEITVRQGVARGIFTATGVCTAPLRSCLHTPQNEALVLTSCSLFLYVHKGHFVLSLRVTLSVESTPCFPLPHFTAIG